uniref:Uncharacterized protein n=1 Tax=Pseudo-nitzschia australis TaxID=44445 RepID=A0A7S4EIY7_9STRA|mmetsp:Transcript_26625/g.58356  ORF Transcript_26625/g.58356 Transcript_26625/m.58356 type:complete len:117 (-) Transcript_26625:1810-2160(-)
MGAYHIQYPVVGERGRVTVNFCLPIVEVAGRMFRSNEGIVVDLTRYTISASRLQVCITLILILVVVEKMPAFICCIVGGLDMSVFLVLFIYSFNANKPTIRVDFASPNKISSKYVL